VRTVAVLPVKRFTRAKQRLRASVDGIARERLAAAMVGDVLQVVTALDELVRVIVVTAEPAAAQLADEAGAHVVRDPDEAGQSAAAALGIVAAVPGDTPGIDRDELLAILARTEPVVIVPDRHGTGTNGLLLAPPAAIAPAFGPGSRARHEAAARAAGVACAILALPSLTHDVDTPEDLAALRARGGLGPRTAAALAELAPVA